MEQSTEGKSLPSTGQRRTLFAEKASKSAKMAAKKGDKNTCIQLERDRKSCATFQASDWKKYYSGKVRELYRAKSKPDLLLMHTTDRVSAFDVVLKQTIPFKGVVLNLLSSFFLQKASSIVPVWALALPDSDKMVGYYAKPLPVECVVRGHISGHAWREYEAGKRTLCGQSLPDGLYQHAQLREPLFTPTTKADLGQKDQDISEHDIIKAELLSSSQLKQLKAYSLALYAQGAAHAKERGLRLLDAKYEFGCKTDGTICLIDELHTPDAARYLYEQSYEEYVSEKEQNGTEEATASLPSALSKEILREYIIKMGQKARVGDVRLTESQIQDISQLYKDLFTILTGENFVSTKSAHDPEGSFWALKV